MILQIIQNFGLPGGQTGVFDAGHKCLLNHKMVGHE